MLHLCGWFADQTYTANQQVSIPALEDSALFTSGPDLRIPAGLGAVQAIGAIQEVAAANTTQFRIESPYLLRRAPHYVNPINDVGLWGSLGGITRIMPGLALTPQESVRAYGINAAPQVAAKWMAVLMWLADTAPQAVTSGDLMTVRATAGTISAVGGWHATTLTWAREIPYGDYRVIGMRASGGGLIAARLVLPGETFRPGVQGIAADQLGSPMWRMGAWGELARFNSNQPPSVELLVAATSTPVIELDLVVM